jgi:hypothetical protein
MFSLGGFFTLSTGESTSRKIFLDVVIVRVVLRSLATVEDDIGNLKETSLNESIAVAPLLVLDCSSFRGDKQAESLFYQAFYPINLRQDISLLTGLLRMSC